MKILQLTLTTRRPDAVTGGTMSSLLELFAGEVAPVLRTTFPSRALGPGSAIPVAAR